MSEAPANESEGELERFRALDYEVDADAVAAAIVARLLAGRLPDVWRSGLNGADRPPAR